LVSAPALAQGPSAKVSDLAWMTGRYTNDSLEENWAEPKGGSIAALVRGMGDGATNMIELIVVEEEGDSLILRLKQWNPGMEPRAEGFQVMDLIEIGNQKVVFKNRGEGLPQLGYSRNGNQFTISIQTPRGPIDIPLTRWTAH
jgi:hypothetical protein